jgi:hypothetical protein
MELLAELGRGGDQQPFQGIDGLGAGLDGALAGHPQAADHLDRAVLGLGGAGGHSGLDGAGGGVGIDWVALAMAAASRPVGPVDLQDSLAVGGQEAGQPGAVTAGALHPPGHGLAQALGPAQQLGVAGGGSRGHGGGQPTSLLVPSSSDMAMLVGVDPDGDLRPRGVCHGGGAILSMRRGGWSHRPGGRTGL